MQITSRIFSTKRFVFYSAQYELQPNNIWHNIWHKINIGYKVVIPSCEELGIDIRMNPCFQAPRVL